MVTALIVPENASISFIHSQRATPSGAITLFTSKHLSVLGLFVPGSVPSETYFKSLNNTFWNPLVGLAINPIGF